MRLATLLLLAFVGCSSKDCPDVFSERTDACGRTCGQVGVLYVNSSDSVCICRDPHGGGSR